MIKLATIGQALTQPESGWKRYGDTNINISKTTYNTVGNSNAYNGSFSEFTQGVQSEASFNFVGTKLRIISVSNTSAYRAPKISIFIDGIEEQYTEITGGVVWQCLVYEKNGLENKEHYVKIKGLSVQGGATFYLDAIDVDADGVIKPYKEIVPIKRMIVKNSVNDKYYSLSDKTLIHLPDNSDKNMILHGIEQGKEIQLDVPFTKHRYFNGSPVVNVCGKVFTHDIGVINTLNIKELVENKSFEPIFTWYNTNMTSNTSPSPLVASASSVYNTTYQAWRAFDGIKDVNAWLTVANTTTGWIKLDFGRKVIINVLKMTCRGGTTDAITKAMPKDFEIYGSNDDSTYTLLGTINNQTNWSFLEERLFVINNSAEYRYIKLNILNNNGFTEYSNIGELIYGYKREVN